MQKNIINKLKFKKLLSHRRNTIGKFSLGGFTFKYIDNLSFYNEYIDIFEKKIYHLTDIKKEPFIIDAGGYIGVATIYFKKLFPKAEILTFEPDSNIFKVLNENITVNDLKNIKLFNSGLGANKGIIRFYPDGADGGSAVSRTNIEPLSARIEKLSQYIAQEVDILKMNIEGMETEVFEEICEKLPLIKNIIFEYHCFDNTPQGLHRILSLLAENNFRYFVTDKVGGGIPIPFKIKNDYKYFNLVYAKNMNYF